MQHCVSAVYSGDNWSIAHPLYTVVGIATSAVHIGDNCSIAHPLCTVVTIAALLISCA